MLAPGPIRLHVSHPDYPAEDVDEIATSGPGGARHHVRLPIGGAIDGALLDAAKAAARWRACR